ncbi:alpha/beta hydrolase [Paenibacillus sp. FSL R7-0333]|nr:alpha/beta hydrolase [Paenibacillus sp. FSL R7-0333]
MLLVVYLYNRYSYKKRESRFPPAGKFVRVNGLPVHYLDEGEGRPIVFLHGGVLRGDDFGKVMKLGTSKGYRTLALDRPGYGYSQRPQSGRAPFALMDQVQWLHLVFKEMGVEKPVLVGHSWSALLVLTYASLYPDQVAGVVTVAGGMYKEGYPAEKGDPLSRLVMMPVVGHVMMNILFPLVGKIMVRSIMKATFAPEPVPADYEDEVYALWLRPAQFRANREDVLQFVPAAEYMKQRYSQIQLPAVILVGERDPFPTREHSFKLNRALPHAELKVLPTAAHMIPHHQPEEVMKAVDTLMEKLKKAELAEIYPTP